MKFHLLVYLVGIVRDLRSFVKIHKSYGNSNLIIYYSELIEKIQLSVEMMYDLFYSGKNVKIFYKKKYALIFLEIFRTLFRFNELKSLSKNGYDFYIEKNIYLEEIAETNDLDYVSKLEDLKKNHFFNISNKKSYKIFLSSNKIELPSKITDALASSNLELGSDFILKEINVNPSKKLNVTFWSMLIHNIKDNFTFLNFLFRDTKTLVELLYVIRPLIYLVLMSSFKKKSFVPITVNLLIDVLILKFERKEETFMNQKLFFHEYKYRVGRMMVYFLREPIFSLITKPFIQKILKVFRIPSFITDLIMSLLSYYSNVHFIL